MKFKKTFNVKQNKYLNLIFKNMTKNQLISHINNIHNSKLNNSNTNFSNINSNGIWSMEPNFKRSTDKLYLVLNNNMTKKAHFFEIPANHSIYEKLYVRDKKGVYRLIFNVSDTEFIENLKFINFINFYKGFVEYN